MNTQKKPSTNAFADRAWSTALCLLLLLLPLHHLAAQAMPPAQELPGKAKGISAALPKWIETTLVDLNFKDADMAAMLDKIHRETGITILREGAPVNVSANMVFHGSLKTALDQIAETFDYIWLPSQKLRNSLLFMKRYRSPEQHPEWHEKEMLHVTEQVCRALQSPFAVSESYGNERNLLHLLYHKLSAEQLQFLYQGEQLSFHDLDGAQTLLLNQQIYSVALGDTAHSWQAMQSRLAHLKDAKLVFHSYAIYKLLTLVFPSSVGGIPDSVVVRYYKDADLGPEAPQPSLVTMPLERTTPLSVQAEDHENSVQSALQRRVDIQMQGGRLGDLLRAVSQISQCKISLADYLQEQNLSLWTRGCSVRSLMDLLAEQNDWGWTYIAARGINIARRDTFVPANLSEVSAAFKIALPPGYRHFLGLGVPANDWLNGDEDKMVKHYRSLPGGDVVAMRNAANKKASKQSADDPVMLRIWPTQPQMFSNPAELPYKDWTPQTKDAVLGSIFAVALRGLFVNRGIDVISGRLTCYESNPDLIRLHLGEQDKEGRFSAFGYSGTTFEPDGSHSMTGFFWTLKNAAAPLPLPLEEISQRYK
jgi:hypothetical protein